MRFRFRCLLLAGSLLLAAAIPARALMGLPHGTGQVQLLFDRIDVHLDTEGGMRVVINGHIANGSLAPLQQIKARVQLSVPQQQPIAMEVPPMDQMKPLGQRTFSVTHTFAHLQVTHPVVRVASLSYHPVNPLQIADWILAGAARQLQRWQIPVADIVFSDLPVRRQTALGVLQTVQPGDKNYAEARRKEGQILIVWARELLNQGHGGEAYALLRQVPEDSPYGEQARRLLR